MIAVRRALVAIAFALFGYCAYVLVDTRIYQARQSRQMDALLHHREDAPATIEGLVGRIEIPRLDVSVIVMEGDTAATLRHAAGHITGTALPGQPGNTGISAHRDTFFRPLRNIRKDDLITVTTLLGSYRYRVVATSIVPPSDVAVLKRSTTEVLTLVTCYPFYFVGAAPDRFIVRAERIT